MMLYAFVKDPAGLVYRVGADCDVPPQLQEKFASYTADGATAAEAEEWDTQMTNAATSGMIPDPSLPTSKSAEGVAAEGAGSTDEGSKEEAADAQA